MFVGRLRGARDWGADISATRLSLAALPLRFRQQAAGSRLAAGGFIRPVLSAGPFELRNEPTRARRCSQGQHPP